MLLRVKVALALTGTTAAVLPMAFQAAGAASTLAARVNTAGGQVYERSGPSPQATALRLHADGAGIAVVCQVYGVQISGYVRDSPNWDRLSTGGYVSDAYVSWGATRPEVPWCGVSTHAAVRASVRTSGGSLIVRSSASTSGRALRTLRNGTALNVACRVWGQTVTGAVRTSAAWAWLGPGQYVSEAYVAWTPEQPVLRWCGEAPASLTPPSTTAFIASAVAPARASMHTYTIPASVTIAQAILESGTGSSTLTRVDHNYFGMKCFGSPGTIAIGCRDYATHECDSSGCFPTTASFRAYRGATDSYADHGNALYTLPRYHSALRYVHDPDSYARALQAAGYATSSTYAADLISLMRRYDLYRYDTSSS
ncbi:MAG TPA: sporangiospore maturation cell wall hydrolase GsmA [Micromonosporaceae bacterium]|nr:sporangiospore maturation cell wall hydrolase GsmA [Micromonosporaceae bacterium]